MNKPANNIYDFVTDLGDDNRLDIELSIRQSGRIIFFHSHPFKERIGWFEFHLKTSALNLVLDGGESRDIGLPLPDNIAGHMHNAHQILAVQMDPKTGDANKGEYIPLIIHQS